MKEKISHLLNSAFLYATPLYVFVLLLKNAASIQTFISERLLGTAVYDSATGIGLLAGLFQWSGVSLATLILIIVATLFTYHMCKRIVRLWELTEQQSD